MVFPNDQELDTIYQTGYSVSHHAGLRLVYQAALDSAQSKTDPESDVQAVLAVAPTQDLTDMATSPQPTEGV